MNFCGKNQQEGQSDVQRGNGNDNDSEPKAKKPRMTLLLTDSESDASDNETDVPNAWLAIKMKIQLPKQKIPLPGGDSIGIVFLFWQTL